MKAWLRWAILATGTTLTATPLAAQVVVPGQEFVRRRSALMEALPDGITLLKARTSQKADEQWGFIQDPSFYYFTGLAETPGAILALDGLNQEAWLFVPPPPASFGVSVERLSIRPGASSARQLGLDQVVGWDRFGDWVRSRLQDGVDTLYLDGSRRPESSGVPDGLRPVSGSRTLWWTTIAEGFPTATVGSAKEAIRRLRWIKSPAEITILRQNALATVQALKAVAERMSPGMRQRETEVTVAAACVDAGAQGPSFWPWTMAGPNARVARLVEAFFRYEHLDRRIEPGDLVRVDVGCANQHYGADVGRTLPVSWTFTPGQRETWDLLVAGYLAGVDAMADGVPLDTVRRSARREIELRASALRTRQARAAARTILDGGDAVWHLHSVGIESGEEALAVLGTGAVVAFEPGVEVDGDAFYLEDMILVTAEGTEILSAGLPHAAAGIESMMGR